MSKSEKVQPTEEDLLQKEGKEEEELKHKKGGKNLFY